MLGALYNIYKPAHYLNHFSYDLESDKKLAEETTVLVESYTVSCVANQKVLYQA